MTAAGIAVEKREIRLPDGPLREVGDFTVDVHLHADVNVEIGVRIVAEGTVTTA